jgi:hypothetical protein
MISVEGGTVSKYEVVIEEGNTWDARTGIHPAKARCKHAHRTLSGARRCLNSLSKAWRDGTHNGWAHFGMIRHDDGTRLSWREQEILEGLDEVEWRRAQGR